MGLPGPPYLKVFNTPASHISLSAIPILCPSELSSNSSSSRSYSSMIRFFTLPEYITPLRPNISLLISIVFTNGRSSKCRIIAQRLSWLIVKGKRRKVYYPINQIQTLNYRKVEAFGFDSRMKGMEVSV